MTPGTGIFTHYKIYINIYLYSADFSFFETDFDQNDFDNHDLLSSFVHDEGQVPVMLRLLNHKFLT